MFVGTIHAFCPELFKAEEPEFLKYEVLHEVQQTIFIDRNSRKSGLTTSTALGGTPLRCFIDTNTYVSALGVLREADLVERKLRSNSVAAGLDAYRALLHEHSYFDYSAIMEEAFVRSRRTADERRLLLPVSDNYFCRSVRRADGA